MAAHHNPLPRSLLRTTREARHQEPMEVLAGELPADLHGHYFVMSTAGDRDSNGLPRPVSDATTILAGDGMITRIDFGADGEERTPTLTRRLLEPPDLMIEDLAFKWMEGWTPEGTSAWRARIRRKLVHTLGAGFSNWGIARMSFILGCRNQLSTALEVLTDGESEPRMIVNWDAGSPWEVDPETLELITPIGERDDWISTIGSPIGLSFLHGGWPFPLCFTSAHPAFDRHTGEAFFVSWSRSLASLMSQLPMIKALKEARNELLVSRLSHKALSEGFDELAPELRGKLRFQAWLEDLTHKFAGFDFVNVVAILRWDGHGPLERWYVTDENGASLGLEETMHQVGVSKDHIVLADTGFKVGPQSIVRDPPIDGRSSRLLRMVFSEPMEESARLWIVKRADLTDDTDKVAAQTITVPVGVVHFSVDYDDSDGTLRLHTAHSAASDVAEWVHESDLNLYTGKPVDRDVVGAFALGVMDGNRLGTLMVDTETGDVKRSLFTYPEPDHWGIGLGAARSMGTSEPNVARNDKLYWTSVGFWPELYTRHVFDLYHSFSQRITPLRRLIAMREEGGPMASLFCFEPETGTVVDVCRAEKGMFFSSPQTLGDKYLALMVWRTPEQEDERPTEVWIFDQHDLRRGPLCRLGLAGWEQGFTMHAAWLPRMPRERQTGYRVSVTDDLKEFLRGWPVPFVRKRMLDLVEQWEKDPPAPWAGPKR